MIASRLPAACLSLALALAACASSVGCAQQEESKTRAAGAQAVTGTGACVCEPGAPVVDPVLLAFLSKARAAHHEADLAETDGDRDRAVAALLRVTSGPRPGGASPPPEVFEVLADTYARLADLQSAKADFDRALGDVEEGLKLAKEKTHFRGHLFEVKGVVEERRSKALKEQGDEAGAARSRKIALDAFEEAIAIQEDVIARALREKEEPPSGDPKLRAEPPGAASSLPSQPVDPR